MKRSRSSSGTSGSSLLRWFFVSVVAVLITVPLVALVAAYAFYIQLDRSLPSTQSLKNYHPPLVASMYAADGSLIGEFYTERRYLVPLKEMPAHLIEAFLAAEDVRFYDHRGVDPIGIVRAMFKNVQAGEIVQGGSTITQQVVKSLLLSPERTWIRKVKEAILAYRIDRSLTKDEILYLYLNQAYLGAGTYGVEAAAQSYFDKHVSELTVSEAAVIAGLPKAPSRYSPFQNFSAARARQRYVLTRMAEAGFITHEEAQRAFAEPLNLATPRYWSLKEMNSFTEEVRRDVEFRYGRDGLYREGLKIYTTLDPKAQLLAENALDRGLRELDKRHGYRGPHRHIPQDEWPQFLKELDERNLDAPHPGERPIEALVLGYEKKTKTCELALGESRVQQLSLADAGWAQSYFRKGSSELQPGDVVWVELVQDKETTKVRLEQEPVIEGAIMSMVPETGRVLCMVGGKDFENSQFNRATQAFRQPGSAFKPIVYAAALDKGFSPASILIDSPFIREDASLQGVWKPANYDHEFWGPILLRDAIIHSRNVVTVKLLNSIGTGYVIDYARRLGIQADLSPNLSLALGASGLPLSDLMTAYSTFANLGERVKPYLIERITDRHGNVLEQHQVERESVIAPETAYIMTHLLQKVIEEGTGRRAARLGRPAAGKTGTTNDLKDAWFIGYTPSVLTGVWVGNDDNRISLGHGETGGRAACPIWLHFMESWLADQPVEAFPIPPGIIFSRIHTGTGLPYEGDDLKTIYCAFAESNPPGMGAGLDDTGEAHETTLYTPPAASFFKSDLF